MVVLMYEAARRHIREDRSFVIYESFRQMFVTVTYTAKFVECVLYFSDSHERRKLKFGVAIPGSSCRFEVEHFFQTVINSASNFKGE
jgi:hypothetical protein